MAQAQGAYGQIIFQQESTYKTAPTPADCKKLHFVDESLKSSRNLITTDIIRSNRNPAAPVRGNIDVSGSIKTHLQAFQLGTILKGAIGVVNTTGTGPYTHTISVGTLPSFFIEKGFTDIGQYFRYLGCKVNKLSISIVPEGFQEVSIDITGAKEVMATTPYDSTVLDAGYRPFDGFSIANIYEGGIAIANVVSADIAIENNLDGDAYVIGGGGERVSLPIGTAKVSGNLKAMFENTSLYQKAINSTESSLRVVYQYGTGNGSAGNEYLEILIPELVYQPNTPIISGPKGVLVEMPFEAYYDNSTEASAIRIILKNTEATI